MTSENPEPVIEVEGIEKQFGTVQALSGASFELRENEVLGLVGDNGAGKSTLIKTLVGMHQPDAGEIRINGDPVTISNPKHARKLGIGTVYQDLALVDELSVSDNIFLGRNPLRKIGGIIPIIDKERMNNRAEQILRDRLEVQLEPESPVEYLSGGERQAVAIARALVTEPEIVLLDEPTSALSKAAVEHVKDLIENLKSSGHSVIIIDHNIEEIMSVTDRIAVLFQGEIVDVVATDQVTRDGIVNMMVSGQSSHTTEEEDNQSVGKQPSDSTSTVG